jgi:hypothetical protein
MLWWVLAGVLAKVSCTIPAWMSLGEGVGLVGLEGVWLRLSVVLVMTAVEAIGHKRTGGRSCAAAVGMVLVTRHHTLLIAVGRVWDVTPLCEWVVRRDGRSSSCLAVAGVVVLVFEAVLVGRLGPGTPARPSSFGFQRGSATAPGARRGIRDRDGVARGCARGSFVVVVVSWCGGSGGVDAVSLYMGARGRVGRLDFVVVDEVPVRVFVVVAVLVVVVVLFVVVALVF